MMIMFMSFSFLCVAGEEMSYNFTNIWSPDVCSITPYTGVGKSVLVQDCPVLEVMRRGYLNIVYAIVGSKGVPVTIFNLND